MGLFGTKPAAGPLLIDVLTPDYLISGQVEPDAQEWVWSYFSTVGKRPPRGLELTVIAAASTRGLPDPALRGTRTSFAYGTALIALIPRSDSAAALFEEWSTVQDHPVAAELLVGPYAASGSFLSDGGAMPTVINDRVAARDVTFTRVDGAGHWGPMQAPLAVVATGMLQVAAATAGRVPA